jgi:hypothetical protein
MACMHSIVVFPPNPSQGVANSCVKRKKRKKRKKNRVNEH